MTPCHSNCVRCELGDDAASIHCNHISYGRHRCRTHMSRQPRGHIMPATRTAIVVSVHRGTYNFHRRSIGDQTTCCLASTLRMQRYLRPPVKAPYLPWIWLGLHKLFRYKDTQFKRMKPSNIFVLINQL